MPLSSWDDFARAAPELAGFGGERLHGKVAYLATVRPDGAPRVHPVTPIVAQGRLFLFMEPSSPKGHDLLRGSGYALHAAVADTSGGGGEFLVRGTARPVEDVQTRAGAVAGAPYPPLARYVLFELDVVEARSTEYEGERPLRRRWGAT